MGDFMEDKIQNDQVTLKGNTYLNVSWTSQNFLKALSILFLHITKWNRNNLGICKKGEQEKAP